MRKLIVCNIISLDGFYEGPGNNVMALPFDEAFDEYNAGLLRNAETLLEGRTTFIQSAHYWPTLADNPYVGSVEQEVAKRLNEMDKVVISDSLSSEEAGPWNDVLIIKRKDAHVAIKKLKNKSGKNIIIFGSHKTWNDLLLAGLVDELHMLIGPALLGVGTPVFEKETPVKLELLEARQLKNSQLVLHRYKVQQ